MAILCSVNSQDQGEQIKVVAQGALCITMREWYNAYYENHNNCPL